MARGDEWLEEACEALRASLTDSGLTLLDQLLFADQYMNLLVGNEVHFNDIGDRHVRRIRAARLKLLGYYWHRDRKRWSKVSPFDPQD